MGMVKYSFEKFKMGTNLKFVKFEKKKNNVENYLYISFDDFILDENLAL